MTFMTTALTIITIALWLFMCRITLDAWINGSITAGAIATTITLATGSLMLTGIRELRR